VKRALALASIVVLAASAALAKPPKMPKPPTAKYTADETFGEGAGSFKINDKKRFTKLKLKPDPEDAKTCGTETIRFKGKKRLRVASRGGYSTWIVGKNTPETPDGVTPIKLTFEVKGTPFRAMFKITFDYDNFKRGSGQLRFGNCLIQFDFSKAGTAAPSPRG
jgi:opacity protein-like surface antigen